MKIYVSHSKGFDYKNELYEPLKNSGLSLDFIFPHEDGSNPFNSKELFEKHLCDLVLAEVSIPSTGQGIELGWANVFKIPIICFYKSGTTPAGSLKVITDKIIEYNDAQHLINKLTSELSLNIA